MRVSHLAVDDFRSWKHTVVEFPPGPTVLVGANGQGKTNLVEALSYLSTFSSHRVGAEAALVRIPEDAAEASPGGAVIRARAVTGDREQVVELEIVRGKANRARINRTQVKPREILGIIRTVVFAPEDLSLVRGDPSVRRAFLDDVAVQMMPIHAALKADFEKIARQRAAVMKSAQRSLRMGRQADLSTLEIWDEQFARASVALTGARARVASLLAEPSARAYDEVADSVRHLHISFDASIDRTVGVDPTIPSSGNLEDEEAQLPRLLAALEHVREREIERGVNLVGAHRDDLTLSLGRMPVKGYASHGESWSVALSLRLGAFEVLGMDGNAPILILDDVFAELDAARREGLAAMTSRADQVLITCAVAEDLPSGLVHHTLRVRMEDGQSQIVGDDE